MNPAGPCQFISAHYKRKPILLGVAEILGPTLNIMDCSRARRLVHGEAKPTKRKNIVSEATETNPTSLKCQKRK